MTTSRIVGIEECVHIKSAAHRFCRSCTDAEQRRPLRHFRKDEDIQEPLNRLLKVLNEE